MFLPSCTKEIKAWSSVESGRDSMVARFEPAAERVGSQLPSMLPGEIEPQGATDANNVPGSTMAEVWSGFVYAREQDLPASGGLRIDICGDRSPNPHKV